MSRYDVEVVYTRKYLFAIEADTSDDAQAKATQQLAEDPSNPESSDLQVIVQRGVN